jgi:protein involved in polysaccharide export with SLBB domain
MFDISGSIMKCKSLLLTLSFVTAVIIIFPITLIAESDLFSYQNLKSGFSSKNNTIEETPETNQSLQYITDFSLTDSLYLVGPGDQFHICVGEKSFYRHVNAEGNLLLKDIGVIAVDSLTLKEAKHRILENLQAKNKNLLCFVNIHKPKSIRVFVTGAVKIPGIYELEGNMRLSDALQLAGEFTYKSKMDEIKITHKNGTEEIVNIKNFFMEGMLTANPYLDQGAIIHVPFIDYNQPLVHVRRDFIMQILQLHQNETLEDIIIKFNSYKDSIPFISAKVTESDGTVKFLSLLEIQKYRPADGAHIEITSPKLNVYVGGAVAISGYKSYKSNFTINQYISQAGILPSSKMSRKITVYHADGTSDKLNSATGTLRPGDMIIVSENYEKKILTYTPLLISLASFSVAIITLLLYQ